MLRGGNSRLVTKAVIAIVGRGRQMQPQSKFMPKALLPIVTQRPGGRIVAEPLINRLLGQLLMNGITQICIVSASNQMELLWSYLDTLGKRSEDRKRITVSALSLVDSSTASLLKYNDLNLATSEKQNDTSKSALSGKELECEISIVVPTSPAGLGDAVLYAEPFVDNEPFLVVASDQVFSKHCLPQLLNAYERVSATDRTDIPTLVDSSNTETRLFGLTAACQCLSSDLHNVGLVRMSPRPWISSYSDVFEVESMAEQPRLEQQASEFYHVNHHHRGRVSSGYWCHLGLAILPPEIFKHLRDIHCENKLADTKGAPEAELNLRVGLQRMLSRRGLLACVVDDVKLSASNPGNYAKTFISLYQQTAKEHENLPRFPASNPASGNIENPANTLKESSRIVRRLINDLPAAVDSPFEPEPHDFLDSSVESEFKTSNTDYEIPTETEADLRKISQQFCGATVTTDEIKVSQSLIAHLASSLVLPPSVHHLLFPLLRTKPYVANATVPISAVTSVNANPHVVSSNGTKDNTMSSTHGEGIENVHRDVLSTASAPGRIDLLGGFANASGAEVLGYTTANRSFCIVKLLAPDDDVASYLTEHNIQQQNAAESATPCDDKLTSSILEIHTQKGDPSFASKTQGNIHIVSIHVDSLSRAVDSMKGTTSTAIPSVESKKEGKHSSHHEMFGENVRGVWSQTVPMSVLSYSTGDQNRLQSEESNSKNAVMPVDIISATEKLVYVDELRERLDQSIDSICAAGEPSHWTHCVIGALYAAVAQWTSHHATDTISAESKIIREKQLLHQLRGGMVIVLVSDIPYNSGLASSAALEAAVTIATTQSLSFNFNDQEHPYAAVEKSSFENEKNAALETGISGDEYSQQMAMRSQCVENEVLGNSRCAGLADTMTVANARANAIVAMKCRTPFLSSEFLHWDELPADLTVVSLLSRNEKSFNKTNEDLHCTAEIAALMGKSLIAFMMQEEESLLSDNFLSPSNPTTLLEFLTDVTPSQLNNRFLTRLPVWISGWDFMRSLPANCPSVLSQFSNINFDQYYPIRAATQFCVEENFRVGQFRLAMQAHSMNRSSTVLQENINSSGFNAPLSGEESSSSSSATILPAPSQLRKKPSLLQLSELMAQSHAGYAACELTSPETNILVELIQRRSVSHDPSLLFVGARASGGDAWRAVSVLMKIPLMPCLDSAQKVDKLTFLKESRFFAHELSRVCDSYQRETHQTCKVIMGSSGTARFHGNWEINPSL